MTANAMLWSHLSDNIHDILLDVLPDSSLAAPGLPAHQPSGFAESVPCIFFPLVFAEVVK